MNTRRLQQETVVDVRMAGVEYRQINLRPPFSVRASLGDDWRLYLIRGGDVLFEADNAARTHQILPSGSVVSMSGVLQHKFSSVNRTKCRLVEVPWVDDPLSQVKGKGITIVIGRIAKSRMAFLALLERIILLPADRYSEIVGRIAKAIDWIAEESARSSPASEAIVQRLAEITTLEVGRFERSVGGIKERSAQQASSDQRILRAVSAFYASPQEKWSVERLAKVAGMSRTAFAIRYAELIGTTPVRSVRQLRMQLAADQLSRPADASVDLTAKRVGYGSNAAFIRAFTKEFGSTPGRIAKLKRR